MKNRFLVLAILVLTASYGIGQPKNVPFEGAITYSYVRMDSASNPLFYPIRMEEDIYSEKSVLTRVLSGDFLRIVGNKEIFLNADESIRYEIDHDDKVIRSLGADRSLRKIKILATQAIRGDTIQGFKCEGISFSALYIDDVNAKTDTIKWVYFISLDLSMPHADLFALPQGNKNTKWMDGRFKAIPLKITSEHSNGEKLICTAVSVNPADERKNIKLPGYRIYQ